MKRTHNLRVVIPVLGLLVTLLAGCKEEAESVAEVVRPVRSIVIQSEQHTVQSSLPGRIQAEKQVDLAFQVPGQLQNLPIKKGEPVVQGQVLASLDPRDYQSNVKSAEAAFRAAEADYKRFQTLKARGLVSQAEIGGRLAARDIAEANMEKARKALSDTEIRAPFSGVVADRFVENFQDVQAKRAILSLQDATSLEIIVNAPEKAVVTNVSGNPPRLEAVFDAFPERRFPVYIKEFATEADPKNQTFEYVLRFDKPSSLNVLPGMSVTVNAYRQHTALNVIAAIQIPAVAVFSDKAIGPSQYVWVVNENSRVESREVSVGDLINDQLEILSGLTEGDRVVTAGASYLHENQQVRLL